MPYRDPVVEEVRANGAKLVEECGGDIHKIAECLRSLQQQHPERVVRRKTRIERDRKERQP